MGNAIRTKSLGQQVLKEMMKHRPMEMDLEDLEIKNKDLKIISRVFTKDTWCSSVRLQKNKFNHIGLEFLARSLTNNKGLQKLYIGDNFIGDKGAFFFSNMIRINTTLKILDFQNSKIGKNGIELLAKALNNNDSIVTVYLSDNSTIADEGGKCFFDNLCATSKLRVVDLSNCGLANKTAKAFGDFLLNNTSLQQCFLLNNNISKKGAECIAKGLKSNKSLRILSLDYNNIQSEGGLSLIKAWDQNNYLEMIEISNNDISPEITNQFEIRVVKKTARSNRDSFQNLK